MRVIVRKERPHPAAQLRFTETGGHRFTCFATDAKGGQLGDLELRHRRRPRCEDSRRRLAEPDLKFRAFCARKGLPASSTLQLERAWDAWQAERYQRGETGQRPGYAGNPFRPR